jgi:heavy metal efflux system protein
MLNKIIAFSIQNKLIIGLMLISLIGFGSYELTKLPIDAVPDITDNQVQVITVTPSLGAPDVERLITFPIEQVNSNIPGLKEIRSFSRFGLSLITIVFEDNIDIYWARQQVSERLKIAQEQIPAGIGSPVLAPVTTGLGEIYQYVLKPKHGFETKYTPTELRTIQDWIVRRQLLNVKGVADVSSFGGRVKQYEIAINPHNLQSHHLSIQDVFTALAKNNENTGGAYIEKTSTVLYIRAEGLIKNIADIKNIVVKNTSNGTPLLISDVAEVQIGNATRYGAMTYNDEGEVAGAVVMMLKGGNSSEVIKDVKAKIEHIKTTLPEGVELEPFLDRTKMVNNAIHTVSKNLVEGALIVMLILIVFLGDIRAGLIVASVIPLSMLFAIIMMNLFGVSGNLMSLGALDFGLIVDGTVIIVEACMFQLHRSTLQKVSQQQMNELVYTSSSRMSNAAVFGALIILVVYLPIFTLKGIEGKMFKPMAQTVSFALIGAFLLSITYVPMISSLVLSKTISHKKTISDTIMAFLEKLHQKYLVKVLAIPKLVIGFVVILFALSVYTLSTLGGEFIPELPEGDFAVETRVLTGSNLTTSTDAILQSAHILLNKFPEVEKIVGKTGSGEIPTDPMPMDASDMMIILKDKSEWTSAESWDELAEKMTEALSSIPGVTFGFQYPVAMRFNELMTGAKQDVVCKIVGENLDTLSKYSKILGGIAGKIEGAGDVYVEPIDGLPQLIITYKRNQIAQYGLNISDINNIVQTAFAGKSSGLVYEDEKRFDLVVRLGGLQRDHIEDVKNLLISTPSGTQIPLYQVADISIKESVNQIQRDDAKRRIVVGFNIHNRDVQSIVNDLQAQIAKQVVLPTGYYITYGGAFKNLQAAKERLSLAVPIALLLIFLLLYFAFSSIKLGLLIYSAIPLSAIGGIFLLAARGMNFSISAGIGFIALFGVAVLNGIVLISEYNRIRKEGETDIRRIVLTGTTLRLRPVLMTAFVASLGFLPMALSNGAGAEVQRPLATVVIGGLLIATLLTLFVLPILYVLFEKGFKHKKSMLLLLVLSGSLIQQVNAQSTISLQAAIDTALKQNLQVRNEQLHMLYQKKVRTLSNGIPQATITGGYGQLNSVYYDNIVGIQQSLNFPTVYSNHRNLQKEFYKNSVLNIQLKEAELTKTVSELFYTLVYLNQKQQMLQRCDSIWGAFSDRTRLRLQKGESDILEKASADIQKGQISMQLDQVNSDLEILQLQFQLLLNSETEYTPDMQYPKLTFEKTFDSTSISNHPSLLMIAQEKKIARANTKLEQSKLLPDIMIGYSNMTMKGTGADNVRYDGSSRFQSVQFGLGIPLVFYNQHSKINAAKIQEQINENRLTFSKQTLSVEYEKAYKHYQTQLQKVTYFEEQALANAKVIMQSANQRLASGETNFLEWSILVNNAIQVESNYTDAVKVLNESIIQLNFLTTN